MDHVWISYGLCTNYSWIMHELRMEYVRTMYGYVWIMCGWIMYGLCMDYGLCMNYVWIVYGSGMEYVSIMCG